MMESSHGGNIRELAVRSGREEKSIIDFSANINPFGPPPWVGGLLGASAEALTRYPDPEASALKDAASERWGIRRDRIVCGNGADELLRMLPLAVQARRIVVCDPGYSGYAHPVNGLPLERFSLSRESGFSLDTEALSAFLESLGGGSLVYIGVPNNPTALLPDLQGLKTLCSHRTQDSFCMDESFLDFLDPAATLAALGLPNVWAVRSLTKFWALPGLRIGLAFAPDVREAFALRRNLPDWPVNTLAQLVGARALAETDEGTLIQRMRDLRAGLESELGRCGNFVKVLPGGKANFLLTELTDPRWDAFRAEAELLSKYGLAVRNCANFLFPGSAGRRYLRIAVKSGAENSLLVDALAELSHVVP